MHGCPRLYAPGLQTGAYVTVLAAMMEAVDSAVCTSYGLWLLQVCLLEILSVFWPCVMKNNLQESHLNKWAAKQSGMHVPGPFTMTCSPLSTCLVYSLYS